MKKYIIGLIVCLCTCSCSLWHKPGNGVVAECNGAVLTESDLRHITASLNRKDSALVAQQYIKQWAIGHVEYAEAKDRVDNSIESKVEDYRRSLYIFEYEQRLLAQHMSKHISDSAVTQFYAEHSSHFQLREPILRGALLIMPVNAPHLEVIKKHMRSCTEPEHLEFIEKYAYQYAFGYELFIDQWRTAGQVLLRIPMNEDQLLRQLKYTSQIFFKDSINAYLLQVTEYHVAKETMPIDYARAEIEKQLRNQQQMNIIRQEREKLYERALLTRKLRVYEK